ncbi:hypothetical protein [Pallidibacillus thermolactis]|jgi:hypothetical protein|uniref:hypothetical protein n=1 Tax=Pallidibacillus thermolactis TaxID=251051 RepID=UPI0021D9AA74|nr:hypothetical protein [Pallidibacillus thermolactis]MCU9601351.1 hypothetical protein [Pallidibacillus thermolactis subsp. kokeshiiformis]MCU9602645.1 hypothetical protein [Pallidibacillus thermolactis subsp. kokeshiiformis]MED1673496.1 hypothetical protein [Pallidibacillus thermolactis subsp. kokeshiiformis]
MDYFKLNSISLKDHPKINEKWVQKIIAEDPSILGLGDIELKDIERKQPRAGRLDFLFQDENNRRYCVEVQLGKTDESHIIRTIEYWDLERKRYPQYEHVAVIVAEDITSRFLNVISLFNGHIPIVAIQMSAFKINENSIGLNFVKVLDETALQTYDDDENSQTMVDRAYWENKASKYTLEIADSLLGIIQEEIDSDIRLKYNKFYIGLERMGLANNFITFKPRKDHLIVQPRLEKNDETDKLLEELGLDVLEYDQRGKCYRIRLKKEDVKEHKEEITKLFIKAETNFNK